MAARFCSNCGRLLTDEEVRFGASTCGACAALTSGAPPTPSEQGTLPSQPVDGETTVNLRIEYPERLSRWLLLIKWLFVIPAYIVVALYGIAVFITTFISFWAILFTGRYPSGLFDFARGYMALQAQTYAYFPLLLTDQYPLASRLKSDWAVRYEIEEPREGLSRGLLLLKLLSLLVSIVSSLTGIMGFVLTIAAIPAWFGILFTGRYPRGMYYFMVAVAQWIARVTAWQYLMRDEWSLFATTRPVAYAVSVGAVAAAVLTIANYATGPLTGGFNFEVETGDQIDTAFITGDIEGEEGQFIDDVFDIDLRTNRDYWLPVQSLFSIGVCDVAAGSGDEECEAAMVVLEDRDPVLVEAMEDLNSLDPPASLLRKWRDKVVEQIEVEHRSNELIMEGWHERRDSTWQEGWDLVARTSDLQLELIELTAQVLEEYDN